MQKAIRKHEYIHPYIDSAIIHRKRDTAINQVTRLTYIHTYIHINDSLLFGKKTRHYYLYSNPIDVHTSIST